MREELNYPDQLQPFSVSDDLLTDILDDSSEIEKIDGYQGTPISGVGDVYTPKSLVEFILDSVDYTAENEIEHVKIADLSCGTGSFIKEIVRRLRNRLIKIGYDPDSPEGARQIISTVKNNIYGYDINSLAVWRTSQLILDTLKREIRSADARNPISTLPVYHTNSLNKRTEIASDKFDIIVGNPPYIRHDEISSEEDKIYREKYDSAIGKYDIYLLFFERAIELLDRGGSLGFVTPDRFHQSDYGKNLREIITNRTYIDQIVKIENDPFPVVNAYPCITILQKQDTSFPNYQKNNYLTYCETTSERLNDLRRSLNTDQGRSEFSDCAQIEQSQLGEDSWQFMPPEIQKLRSRIGKDLTRIKQTGIQIRAGIATGADDIFILNESDAQRMSNQVVYPLIRGKNIRKGEINQDLYIFNPYNSNGEVIDLDDYPQVKEYLEYHRPDLQDRYCVREKGKLWYETHDTIKTNLETERRIVTPDLTSHSRFAVAERMISHNTCYSIFYDGDLKTLAAILNSSVFEFILKSSLPEMDSGFWRQMKRDLVDLQVILPTEIDPSVADELADNYDNKRWEKVNSIMYEILGLNGEEVEQIESFIN
ncbi:Eco57I restriction-modification methylase domain-containing protein [Halapricum desulfuricans]|uniref:site-specific DNA-methyltransferase (adenine-specific) n=1 Tax=Halapricum desulfuricans TaxID=2841257 RepID=A0A897NMN3_9EURY|nr:N-6 DNA methylase [Halapricum desulfuricans]QSG13694.1 Type II restriction enzyme, methylase subunit [Halapricum desulfuricans]